MTKQEFQKLTEDHVLLLDGATGSNLMKAGMPRGVCTESWVLEHKDVIQSLQKAYIEAGSNIIYAPTFGGNRINLTMHGLEDQIEQINHTLAMDRQNLLLKDKYNDHHPALVKMIRMVTEAGHKSGCEVYICGELAADSNLTEAFIQMGVDGLSVVPACVLPVRKAIRSSYADDANRSEEAVKEK